MYNQSDEQIKSILDVWRAIEHLTPFKNENLQQYFEAVEEYKEKKLLDEKFSHKLKDEEALFLLEDKPFEEFDKKDLDIDLDENDVAVYWNIYLGYLKWSEAEIDILKKLVT